MLERIAYAPVEVAELLGVSDDLVRALVRSGELPAIRLGRLIRIPAGALEGLVAQYTRDHAAAADARQRRGLGLPGARPAPALGGDRRRRVARRSARPTDTLRGEPAGGTRDAR